MWHSNEWLETVLKGYTNAKTVQRVISIKEEPLVEKGDNFISDLLKLTAKTVDGSGVTANKTYVLKVIPEIPVMRKMAQGTGMFPTEIKMFSQVLNEMEILMNNVNDWRDPLWCRSLALDIKYGILLEDLKPLGYKIGDRQKGLDMDHSKIALSALGRFHAMSVVLHENFVFRKEDFSYTQLFTNAADPMMFTIAKDSVDCLAEVILETWPSEWHEIGLKIQSMSETILDTLHELIKEQHSPFCVLNHGDLWVNNMMFRYDVESEQVCGIRFIDFQLSNWSSPAFDLHYFFMTSMKFELARLHYDELLSCYHKSLLRTFEIMQHKPKVEFTLSQLHAEMDRVLPFAFQASAIMLPKMYANKDELVDLEEILKGKSASKEITRKPYKGKAFTHAMKLIIPFFKNKGLFC